MQAKIEPKIFVQSWRMTCFEEGRMFGALKRLFTKSPAKGTALLDPAVTEKGQKGPQSDRSNPSKIVAFPGSEAKGSDVQGIVSVTYSSILKQLPQELHGKNSPHSSAKFCIPASEVMAQLTRGTVKVSFGELRRAAPTGIFRNTSDQDSREVELPLREILSQIKPEAFARRSRQRLEVSDDITDLFGQKGELLARLRVMEKQEVTKAPPPPPAPPTPSRSASTSFQSQTKQAPKPGHVLSSPAKTAGSAPALSLSGSPANAPVNPGPTLAESAVPAPILAPQPHGGLAESVVVAIAELAKFGSEAIQQELLELNLEDAQCHLPLSQIGRAVRNGVVQLPWQTARSWIRPQPGQGWSQATGEAMLEIPLKVIAALTLTQAQSAHPKASSEAPASQPIRMPAAPITSPAPKAPKGAALPALPTTKASKPLPVPAAPRPAPPAETNEPTVRLGLAAAIKNWPAALRTELSSPRFTHTNLELPRSLVEPGLKAGKVELMWQDLQQWIKPPLPPEVGAAHAEMSLELPLPLLVPLLFSNRSGAAPKRANPADDIPDLFNTASSAAAQPAEPAVEQTTVTPEPKPAPPSPSEAKQPVASAAKPEPKDLAELFGEPEKRNWTPNEIVHKTTLLPGVRGSLIALQDGLLVASCMPPNWKTETIAAFLPQIFGRMNQYAKELKMGELNCVTFTVEQGTLQIYNAGIIYFASLGEAGAPMPSSLNLIARELSRHTR